jgi:hypothetical protein
MVKALVYVKKLKGLIILFHMLKSSHTACYMMIWKKKIEWRTKQGFKRWKNKKLFISLYFLGSLVQEQIIQQTCGNPTKHSCDSFSKI